MRERERGGRWLMVVSVFTWCWLMAGRVAADPERGSLRIVVQPEGEWVLAGNTLNVSIGLRDAHNHPSPAPSAFVIVLAVIPSVSGAASTVTIPAGQSVATLQ